MKKSLTTANTCLFKRNSPSPYPLPQVGEGIKFPQLGAYAPNFSSGI
jgi:hypothetical protein